MAKSFFSEPSENSKIKAAIVSKYFWAWAKIIGPRSEKLAYIDLFAGPGRYSDGVKSTPLLVLEQAIKDPLLCQKLVTIFNDAAPENVQSLKDEILTVENISLLKNQPAVQNKEIDEETAKELEAMRLIPSLCFFDPFGYKGLSLRLINAVLKDWACECVFFFNFNRINMGVGNDRVKGHMEALFGSDSMEEIRKKLEPLAPDEREFLLLEELAKALAKLGGRYVLPFRFRNEAGTRTSHYLIFVSKHPLGYGIMKGIMANASSREAQGVPSFEYCAADSRFPLLFELNRPLDALEGMLLRDFEGQSLSMGSIFERHNVGTPYIDRNYKEVLSKLETEKKIVASPPASERPKRKGNPTFADHVMVTFPRR